MSEDTKATALREKIATAICKSGKFETGEGTCAVLCMDHLGSARRSCGHAERIHGKLADQIIAVLPDARDDAAQARIAELEAEAGRLHHIAAVARGIVHSLATQDLYEPIADNGGTVIDLLVHDAKRIHAALSDRAP